MFQFQIFLPYWWIVAHHNVHASQWRRVSIAHDGVHVNAKHDENTPKCTSSTVFRPWKHLLNILNSYSHLLSPINITFYESRKVFGCDLVINIVKLFKVILWILESFLVLKLLWVMLFVKNGTSSEGWQEWTHKIL